MVSVKVRDLSFFERSIPAAAKKSKVAQGYVAEASLFLEYAPELADAVIDGRLEACRRAG
jgi:hypothetical protein